jgi:hypothetical protein
MTPIQTPMAGSWTVRVIAVRPFTIHGDRYFELHAVRTDVPAAPEQRMSLKVPEHAVAAEPQPGQVLVVSFLMGQVTGAKPA